MRSLLPDIDPSERLSPDDQAVRSGDEWLADALLVQAARAKRQAAPRGVWLNCGDTCLPTCVYCDADCRSDHEQREAALARQGVQPS